MELTLCILILAVFILGVSFVRFANSVTEHIELLYTQINDLLRIIERATRNERFQDDGK